MDLEDMMNDFLEDREKVSEKSMLEQQYNISNFREKKRILEEIKVILSKRVQDQMSIINK